MDKMIMEQLIFHPQTTVSDKILKTFQKDAGWPKAIQLRNAKQNPKGKTSLAAVELQKNIIGIARLELAAPEFCFISDMVILSPYRGKGIGRWFVKQIEAHCNIFHIKRLILQSNPTNLQFYQLLGFKPDPRVLTFLTKEINQYASAFQNADAATILLGNKIDNNIWHHQI